MEMKEMLWHTGGKWPKTVKKTLKDKYPNEPLFKILDKTAKKSGSLTYMIFEGKSSTFAEVHENANRIANFLVKDKDIKKGDRVAIFLPNLPHYPAIFFGILKAGAIAVTCNPMYTVSELNFQLTDTGARLIFCMDHEKYTPICYDAVKNTEIEAVVVCSVSKYVPKTKAIFGNILGKIPKSPYYQENITVFYDDVISTSEPVALKVELNPEEDLALIQYTGGTTGTPKGAMLSHRNLYSNILQHDEYVQLITEEYVIEPRRYQYGEEVLIGALPWYHSYGLTLTMLMGAYIAGTVIVIADPRAGDPPLSVVLESIHKYKGTVLHAVPTMYSAIANHPNVDKYDLSSLRFLGSTGEPWDPDSWNWFFEKVGKKRIPIINISGGTEIVGCFLSPLPITELKPCTLRGPGLAMDIDVFDDDGKPIRGKMGHLVAKKPAPSMTRGFWNEPDRYIDTYWSKWPNIWYHGDWAKIDEDGFWSLHGRSDDTIKVAGRRTGPAEIEAALIEYPAVSEAATIGVPDELKGEDIVCFVVLKPGYEPSEELREELKGQVVKIMGKTLKPRDIKFVKDLPKTRSAKIVRRIIKATFLGEEIKDISSVENTQAIDEIKNAF